MSSLNDKSLAARLRGPEQRRVPPDRGIVLLSAKGRIGPQIWALYGKVDTPAILKDDKYEDNRDNEFYRDSKGCALLLLPYVSQDDPKRYELVDKIYRRSVGLGITESSMIFFTCVYQFDVPDYCCIAVHEASGDDILAEEKCHTLVHFERARLGEQMGETRFSVEQGRKVKPVTIHSNRPASTNLALALNMLVLHHQYSEKALQTLWDS